MSLTEDKRIWIYGYNVEQMNDKGIQEPTKFINKLLEQFFNEILVELDKENKEYLDSISVVIKRPVNDVVNTVLKTIEIVPPKVEKVKVELEDDKPAIKRKRIRGSII